MKYLLLLLLLFSPGLSSAQIQSVTRKTASPAQFRLVEFEMVLKSEFSNPFDQNELALDLLFTSQSGKTHRLPAFYESGKSGESSLWKARFAPKESGEYTVSAELRHKSTGVSTFPAEKFRVSATRDRGFLSVATLWTLRYDNGDPFRGIGENFGWESRDEDDSKFFRALHEDKRFNYPTFLTKLQQNGGNFFRTWMIHWNLPVDFRTPQNNSRYTKTTAAYNESGLRRMDELVRLCDSLGIHMMLALDSHVGYMGGGWDISSYNIKNGGSASTPAEFFSKPEARAQYKNKLRLLVARYGYSPSIAMWEFFNEIDNVMYHGKPEERIPDALITDWHNEMSVYLKNIDPFDHIVTTSVSHRDVEGMNDLPGIDINQRHIYRHTYAIPGLLADYSTKHKKPFVIGEFGYEWDWSMNFNDFAAEMDGDFKRGLWFGLFNPTPVLPMSWWWEFFENRGLMTYFKTVQSVNRDMLSAGKGALATKTITATTDSVAVYGVQAGKTTFVYLYNTAKSSRPVSIQLSSEKQKKINVTLTNTETGKQTRSKATVSETGVLTLSKNQLLPKSDLILRWE